MIINLYTSTTGKNLRFQKFTVIKKLNKIIKNNKKLQGKLCSGFLNIHI